MLPEWIQSWLPTIGIACGTLLLAIGQRDRLTALVAKLRPAAKPQPSLTAHELFARLYDLRSWCESAGKTEAVKAIDAALLPAIVQGEPKP
jgi:hypothetical protein